MTFLTSRFFPCFNVPGVLMVCIVAMIGVHGQPPAPVNIVTADTLLAASSSAPYVIEADNIVFDCGGNAIAPPPGPPTFVPGIRIENRKGIVIKNCDISGFLHGIEIIASSVELDDVSLTNNLVNGLESTDSSRILITGSFTANGNTVFGINSLNDVTITLRGATAVVNNNSAAGLQIGVRGSVVIDADAGAMKPPSSLTANGNGNFGMTITSNSHLFLFGDASVYTRNNGSNGLTCFSKSAIEIDRNGVIESTDNTLNGLLMEDSSFNMFTINPLTRPNLLLSNNGRDGLSIGKAGVFDTNGDADTTLEDNGRHGVFVDENSIVTLQGATVQDNTDDDIKIVFGSQATLQDVVMGDAKVTCDLSTRPLIRGNGPNNCKF